MPKEVPLTEAPQEVQNLAVASLEKCLTTDNLVNLKTCEDNVLKDQNVTSETTVSSPLETPSGCVSEEKDPNRRNTSDTQDVCSQNRNSVDSLSENSFKSGNSFKDDDPFASKTMSSSDTNECDFHDASPGRNTVNQLLTLCRAALRNEFPENFEMNPRYHSDIETKGSSEETSKQSEIKPENSLGIIPTLKVFTENTLSKDLPDKAASSNYFCSLAVKPCFSSNDHSSLGSSPAGLPSQSTDLESTLSTSPFWSDMPTDHDGDISGDSLDSIKTAAEILSPSANLLAMATTLSSSEPLAITELPKENDDGMQTEAEDFSGAEGYASARSSEEPEDIESYQPQGEGAHLVTLQSNVNEPENIQLQGDVDPEENLLVGDVVDPENIQLQGDVADPVKDLVGDVADPVKDLVGDVTDPVKDLVGDVPDPVKDLVGDVADPVNDLLVGDVADPVNDLLVGDVADPVNDLLVGDVADPVNDLLVGDVADPVNDLLVGDVADPVNDLLVGDVADPGNDLLVGDVADPGNDLLVGDVADPGNDLLVGDVADPGNDLLVGDVADPGKDLLVGDVADPGNDLLVGDVADPGNDLLVGDVADPGNDLLVGDVTDPGKDLLGGDVADPGNMPQNDVAEIESVDIQNFIGHDNNLPQNIAGPASVPIEDGAAGPASVPIEDGAAGPASVPIEDGAAGPASVPIEDCAAGPASVPIEDGAAGPSSVPIEDGAAGPSIVQSEDATGADAAGSETLPPHSWEPRIETWNIFSWKKSCRFKMAAFFFGIRIQWW